MKSASSEASNELKSVKQPGLALKRVSNSFSPQRRMPAKDIST